MLVRATRQVWGKTKSFSAENKLFLAFKTFAKAFLWHKRWGVGVTSANFCITSGDKKSKVTKTLFPRKVSYFWPSRPLKRPCCGSRGEGVVSRVPLFASRGATSQLKEPRVMQKVARVTPPPHLESHNKAFSKVEKAKNNWLWAEKEFLSLWTFCRHEWCKSWHEWHQPLTSSATKKAFEKVAKAKNNFFSAEKLVVATEDLSRCSNQHDRKLFHIV